MAAKRSERLKVVLQMALKAQQDVADLMAQQQQKIGVERDQLQQLQQYSLEYQQQVASNNKGLRAQELISSRAFLQRLSNLQLNQQQKIQQLNAVVEQLTTEWQKRYHRRQSIEKLIERLKTEESAELDKQLQREIDELSSQAFFRKDKR